MTHSAAIEKPAAVSAHTPGPWVIDHATRGYEVCTIHQLPPNENGQKWAYVYPPSYHWAEPEEQLANARLIAAAPDLLEALKALYAATPDNEGGDLGKACQAARAAITRAEGR